MRAHTTKYLFLLLFLMSCSLGVMAQNPGKAAYMQAENLRKGKRYQEAVAKYEEAIRLEDSNYRYYFSRGKCYYAMKEFDLALSSFEETVELKKDFVFAYTLIAKIYKKKGDNANAVYYYDMASKAEGDPKRKVGYKMEAVKLLLRDNKSEEAQRHLAEAKQFAPDDLGILYFDAKISNKNGDYERARDNMVTATSQVANEPPATSAKYFYELGYAYNKLDDYNSAQQAWEKAYFGPYKPAIDRERSKNSPAYFYRIAISYYIAGQYQDARGQIDKALELQNNFGAAYTLMGKMAKKEGNYSGAIDNFRSAANFEQDPNKKMRLKMMMTSLQVDSKDYSGAISSANDILSKQPGNSKVMYFKALSQYHVGEYGGSISTLESLLSNTSDNKSKARYNFILGMAAKNTDVDRAKEAFRAAMFGPYKPAAKIEYDKLNGSAG